MLNHTFHQGEIIFREGDFAPTMHDIVAGKVGLYAGYNTSEEKKLATLEAGESFGEMGMIERLPRTATAVALEEGTQTEEIGEHEFSDYFRTRPVQVFLIMKQMSRRLRETTQNYREACRTVYETVEADKNKEERSNGLKKRLNFFAQIFRSSKAAK